MHFSACFYFPDMVIYNKQYKRGIKNENCCLFGYGWHYC